MRSLLSKIKKAIFDVRFTPVILLLLCLLSYGIFIPVTGFFIDDWYIMWFKHFFGALQFPAYFALDRPFQGLFYPAASSLLLGSESPIIWGMFAVIMRWLSTLALWGMLKTLWPNDDRRNNFVVLLAAVFPGFTQHWFVVQFSYIYTCLAFFFLSLTFMIKSIREPKKFWIYYPLSILLGFYSMTSEYFFGLELIRPVILFIEFKRMDLAFGKRILSVLKYWSAFFVYFIGFAIWRFFFFVSVNHATAFTNMFNENPLAALTSTARSFFQSIMNAVINSWANPFNPSNYPEKGVASILIPLIMGLVFIGLIVWLFLSRKRNDPEKKVDGSSWRCEALILSISALIFAGIPFLAAGLTVDFIGFDSRYLLAYLFGSCLLVVIIFDSLLFWSKKEFAFIPIALLVAVALGYQVSVAKVYKNVWLQQTQFYWQLNWRIPGLQTAATLFTYGFPSNSDLYSGNALTAQLNWTYSDKVVNRQVDYQFMILESGQGSLVESLDKNVPIHISFRTYNFEGNTSKSIYINPPSQGCLRIFDQDLTPPETVIPKFELIPFNPIRKDILSGSALTDLNLILKDGGSPNHPPLQILGREAPHAWCYYFEKAELARQDGNYGQAISLLKEATAKGYSPSVDTEWYSFVDAYARTGDWQNAEKITNELSANADPTVNLGLCHLWQNLAKDFTDPVSSKISGDMITLILGCKK
jgi:hypothetical protein